MARKKHLLKQDIQVVKAWAVWAAGTYEREYLRFAGSTRLDMAYMDFIIEKLTKAAKKENMAKRLKWDGITGASKLLKLIKEEKWTEAHILALNICARKGNIKTKNS